MKKPTTTEDVTMARIECDDLFGTVLGALKDYRCTHTFEEDGDGSRLVDLLSPGPTIKEGQEELELLAESIACEIADFIAGEISSQPNACVSDGPADAHKSTRSAEGPFAARNG